jgi:hypothetical protein
MCKSYQYLIHLTHAVDACGSDHSYCTVSGGNKNNLHSNAFKRNRTFSNEGLDLVGLHLLRKYVKFGYGPQTNKPKQQYYNSTHTWTTTLPVDTNKTLTLSMNTSILTFSLYHFITWHLRYIIWTLQSFMVLKEDELHVRLPPSSEAANGSRRDSGYAHNWSRTS